MGGYTYREHDSDWTVVWVDIPIESMIVIEL